MDAVKFPLQVHIDFDEDLIWKDIGKEDFIRQNLEAWNSGGKQKSTQVDKNMAEQKFIEKTSRVKL